MKLFLPKKQGISDGFTPLEAERPASLGAGDECRAILANAGSHAPRELLTGFTVVEAIIAIGIIGIMAAIIATAFNTARIKARDAHRVADIKQIQNALELYFSSRVPQEYPPASPLCDATHAYGLEALVRTGAMSALPRDPSLVPDCYLYTAEEFPPRSVYHLGAILEDVTHKALGADKDCNSRIAASPAETSHICAPETEYGPPGTQFDGAIPQIYDVAL